MCGEFTIISIVAEISPEYSLEGLMLKLQYFGHLMQRASSLEKTLMLGKIEGKRRRGHTRWETNFPQGQLSKTVRGNRTTTASRSR